MGEKKLDRKKSCFIITPIGSTDSEIRREINGIIDEVINPVLEEMGYVSNNVSHRKNNSCLITPDIIKSIYTADLCIANLTGCNANVMYELALRHAIGKHVIIITDNVSSLPFDINDQRAIEYKNDMQGALDLKNNLKLAINYIDDHFDEISNPILDGLKKIIFDDELTINLKNEYKESLEEIKSNIVALRQILNQKDIGKKDEMPLYLKDILKNHDIKMTAFKAKLNILKKINDIDNLNLSLQELDSYIRELDQICRLCSKRTEDAVFNKMYQDAKSLMDSCRKCLENSSIY